MFSSPFDYSIIKRAQEQNKVDIQIHNIRDYTTDKHKTADDRPYGGGSGMLLKPEPVFSAVEAITTQSKQQPHTILLTPQGHKLTQQKAKTLSELKSIILICGHYEGVDERIRQYLVDEEISIGDYVLTGGEIPAMVLTDCVTRLLPKVLAPEAVKNESFSNGNVLDYPQYTRPENFRGWKVPKVLLSGNHEEIKNWRNQQRKLATGRG